jgi:hypothetical protein
MGTQGMMSLRGSIVRPYGIAISREMPRPPETAQLGWKGRLRQHALVHTIAQRTGRSSRSRGASLDFHYAGNGYHYEADEVRACVQRGALESAEMPLADSIQVAATADMIRSALRKESTEKPA